jgi:hypothetical protein
LQIQLWNEKDLLVDIVHGIQ